MKRLAIAALVLGICARAVAQAPDGDTKAFVSRYVAAFNRGDAGTLARDFYEIPGLKPTDVQPKLEAQLDELRKDEFGKLDVYKITPCADGPDTAKVQMDFDLQYTFGGVMKPSDRSTVFDLKKTPNGWRITAFIDPAVKLTCPK